MKSATGRSKNTSRQSLSKPKESSKKTSTAPFQLPTQLGDAVVKDEELAEDDVPRSSEKYEERYIAFIDILGFKELVKRSQNTEHGASALNSIFNALNLNFEGFARDYEAMAQQPDSFTDLRVNSFSDFVVASTQANERGLDLLLFVVWCVARDWLSKGYLSRGGITKGSVIHVGGTELKPGLVFGPAFIDAYLLEQEVADFPRVVLSKQVRADVRQFRRDGKNTIEAIDKLITKCDDGPFAVDLFGHLRRSGFQFLGKSHTAEAEQFHQTLKDQLEHGADIPKWHRKSAWLIEQFNDAVRSTSYADKTITIDDYFK